MPPSAVPKAVSFDPDQMVAGGLINDVDVEVEHAEFTPNGPEGYTKSALFLKMSLKDSEGAITDQYWSAGQKAFSNFTPSDDGTKLLATGGATALNKDSNLWVFMTSLKGKGFPADKMNDLANLKGLKMHVIRIPLKVSAGMSSSEGDQARTVLVCEKIINLPGERGKGRPAAKPATGSSTPAAAKGKPPASASTTAAQPAAESEGSGSDFNDSLALSTIQSILRAAEGNTMTLKFIRVTVFKALKESKTETRNAVIALCTDAAWLESHDLMVDGDSVTLVE